MSWNNLDKIFIGNTDSFSTENYGHVDKKWIEANNPLYLDRIILQPVGTNGEIVSLIRKEIIRYYRDGRIERKNEYIASPSMVDGITSLNAFGAKVFRQVSREENQIND